MRKKPPFPHGMFVAAAKGTMCSGTRRTFDIGFDGSWLVCRVPDQAGITVRATRARDLGRPVNRVIDGARLSDMSLYHNTARHDAAYGKYNLMV